MLYTGAAFVVACDVQLWFIVSKHQRSHLTPVFCARYSGERCSNRSTCLARRSTDLSTSWTSLSSAATALCCRQLIVCPQASSPNSLSQVSQANAECAQVMRHFSTCFSSLLTVWTIRRVANIKRPSQGQKD
jgi:hypothetical protein